MQIISGHIYKTNKSEFLVIDKTENNKFKVIPIEKSSSKGIRIKELDASAIIENITEINLSEIKSEILKLDYEIYDEVLRELVKYTSKIFFKNTTEKPAKSYIPAAGKVLDESELNNMIDASLDMWLTSGRFNSKFENELSKFLDVKFALTVNSGSSANLLALTALTSHKLGAKRLKQNDEIITVAASFPTTVAPIIQNGLIPVFQK